MRLKIFRTFIYLLFLVLPLSHHSLAQNHITVAAEPGTDPKLVSIVENVVSSFNGIIAKQLKVTLTKDVKIFICPNKTSYAAVLEREFEMPALIANRKASLSGGIAARDEDKNLIAINLDPDDNYDPEHHAYYSTAHELTHQLQFELSAGKMEHTLYWLIEGSAEYIAAEVIAEMKYKPISDWTVFNFYIVRNNKSVTPSQITYIKGFQWESFMEEDQNPYEVASLMVLYLSSATNKNIKEAIIDYYRQAAQNPDDAANFEKSFGIPLTEFSQKVGNWMLRSTASLSKPDIDSLGNYDQDCAFDEGIQLSQAFFKENFDQIVQAKQRVVIAPETLSYIKALSKEYHFSRTEAMELAKTSSLWSVGSKTVANLDQFTDFTTIFNSMAAIMTKQLLNQQDPKHRLNQIMWLRNGIISVFTAEISDQSFIKPLSSYRAQWLKSLDPKPPSLSLTKLQSEAGWNEAVNKYGETIVQNYSALAVLYLLELKGLSSFKPLFVKNSEFGPTAEQLFNQIFSISSEAFEQRFKTNIYN